MPLAPIVVGSVPNLMVMCLEMSTFEYLSARAKRISPCRFSELLKRYWSPAERVEVGTVGAGPEAGRAVKTSSASASL
jgi:hypothetical protein